MKRKSNDNIESSGSALPAATSTLPVHDVKGYVCFLLPREIKDLIGEPDFEGACNDLLDAYWKLIIRSPQGIVYVHLQTITLPVGSEYLPPASPVQSSISKSSSPKSRSSTKPSAGKSEPARPRVEESRPTNNFKTPAKRRSSSKSPSTNPLKR